MNTQATGALPALSRDRVEVLAAGRVLPLGAVGGTLEVLGGRVWLTRSGDLDDHFAAAGEVVVVPASGDALVASIDDTTPALVAWRPLGVIERVAAAVRAIGGRCWEIVEPAPRIGAGERSFGAAQEARRRTPGVA